MNDVEKTVQTFYDTFGWVETAGVSGEDALFRKFSPPYYLYHDGVNDRTLKCFSTLGGKLLMAGGGDLPETHVAIAKMFSPTTFLDISDRALAIAKKKFDGQAEYSACIARGYSEAGTLLRRSLLRTCHLSH